MYPASPPISLRPPPIFPEKTTVGITAPASAAKDPHSLEAGIAYLTSLGLNVKTLRSTFDTTSYLSGSDEERSWEFNTLLRDPEVHAIFCIRGGYGTLRILPLIDYEAAARSPKLVVGYSDITALQLALFARAGLPSISGPMVSTDWAHSHPESERLFLDLAGGHTPAPLIGPSGNPLQSLKPGTTRGTLLGGNLSILTRLIGTPYLPSFEGAILFMEDVGETAYRIDGMLAHLKLSGIWDALGGLVIGEFTESTSPERTSEEIESVFRDYCQDAPFPVAKGLQYGHIPAKSAIPIGVEALLDVSHDTAMLSILEPVVAH